MIIAGKAQPTPTQFENARQRGFTHIELMLLPRHLDRDAQTAELCEQSSLTISTIHTPHVSMENSAYIESADELAATLGATLVVHSASISLHHLTTEFEYEFQAPTHAFETNPGGSLHLIDNAVFEQNEQFVFDAAHVYMATSSYYDRVETLFEQHAEDIPVVHLCDSTKLRDGLGFGHGDIEMRRLCELVIDKHEGTVVMEVMPEHQGHAREFFQRCLTDRAKTH